MALMSLAGYAKHRGVTHQAVQRAMKAGRIPAILDSEGRRRIDSEVADAAWDALTDGKRARRTSPDAQPKPGTPQASFLATLSARERLDTAQAELKELEVAQMKRELVNAEEIRKAAFVWSQAFREAVMALPDRLAAELAAESDIVKVHEKLSSDCRRLCEDLATWRPPEALK